MKISSIYLLCACLIIFAVSCRKDNSPLPETEKTLPTSQAGIDLKRLYVLNSGSLNQNNASLDFLDLTTGKYQTNVYGAANPTVVKGLGDVGNDLGIYGSKLYIVVNNSNLIEVVDKHSLKHLAQINITNCRNVSFHANHAYASAYLGSVGDPTASNGAVFEIDTSSLKITRKVEVGRQPEEMAIVGEKLYVANSGGYSASNYERTLSVIDLASFTELKRIDVAINLNKVRADKYGDLYVSSQGNYNDIPSDLYVIDTKTDKVKKDFKMQVSNLWIAGDTAYLYGANYSSVTKQTTITYGSIDVRDETVIDKSYISDGTEKQIKAPSAIAVNPVTKEVYVADAKDYTVSGTLYCFDKEGKREWSVTTGVIPAQFAFLY